MYMSIRFAKLRTTLKWDSKWIVLGFDMEMCSTIHHILVQVCVLCNTHGNRAGPPPGCVCVYKCFLSLSSHTKQLQPKYANGKAWSMADLEKWPSYLTSKFSLVKLPRSCWEYKWEFVFHRGSSLENKY